MRKAIHISIIIIFLIGIITLEQLLTQNYLTETNNLVEQLITISETSENVNTDEIIAKTNELEKFWDKKEKVICTFVNHKEIEDVGVEISKLKSAIEENEKQVYVESINLVAFYLKAYQHIIGINIQSIF